MTLQKDDQLEWLPIEGVRVHHGPPLGDGYQRPPKMHQIGDIAKNFDPDKLGTLTASRRDDGLLYVIDGQQRILAMREIGWGDQNAPFHVYTGLTQADEAKIFRALNGARTLVQAVYLFNAAVSEGDQTAIAITTLLANLGLEVAFGPKTGNIQAITSVEQIYKVSGAEVLRSTLQTCIAAWGLRATSFKGDLIKALAGLFDNYPTLLDKARLVTVLTRHSPDQYAIRARTLRGSETMSQYLAIIRCIRSDYNHRLATDKQLPMFEGKRHGYSSALKAGQEAPDRPRALSAELVTKIRTMAVQGSKRREIAAAAGVSMSQVNSVLDAKRKRK